MMFINLKSCEHVVYSGSYGFIIVIFKIGLVVCDLDKCLDNNVKHMSKSY
jgi:hypothetical protein